MSLDWSSLLSGLTKPLFNTVDGIISRSVTDKNARAKAQEDIAKAQADMQASLLKAVTENATAQIEVNKVEAASASLFVAGWRPAIGWVCGSALAWQYVLEPMVTWLATVSQGIWHFVIPPLPVLDTSQMMPVLLGMLGLGGLRTYERIKDVSRSSLKGDSIDQP